MRIAVGDARLFFDVDGAKHVPDGASMRERPTVLVLHTGPGADHTPYREHVGPTLRTVAQVLYVDLRGHGRSDRSYPGQWNLATWTSDLAGLLDALELDSVVVLGAGWGCYPGVLLAARHPERVSKLVLVNPVARLVPARIVAQYDILGGGRAGEVAHAFFGDPNEKTMAEYLRVCFTYLIPGLAGTDILLSMRWNLELAGDWYAGEGRSVDLRNDLAAVQAPTLVLVGERDPQHPLASVLEAVEALPPGLTEVRRYPEAHHSPMRDAPESLAAIAEFVVR